MHRPYDLKRPNAKRRAEVLFCLTSAPSTKMKLKIEEKNKRRFVVSRCDCRKDEKVLTHKGVWKRIFPMKKCVRRKKFKGCRVNKKSHKNLPWWGNGTHLGMISYSDIHFLLFPLEVFTITYIIYTAYHFCHLDVTALGILLLLVSYFEFELRSIELNIQKTEKKLLCEIIRTSISPQTG